MSVPATTTSSERTERTPLTSRQQSIHDSDADGDHDMEDGVSSALGTLADGGSDARMGEVGADDDDELARKPRISWRLHAPKPPPKAPAPPAKKPFLGGKKKRKITDDQIDQLEITFAKVPNPDQALRHELCTKFDIDPRSMAAWFQNRRAAEKRTQSKIRAAAKKAAAGVPRISSSASTSATSTTGEDEDVDELADDSADEIEIDFSGRGTPASTRSGLSEAPEDVPRNEVPRPPTTTRKQPAATAERATKTKLASRSGTASGSSTPAPSGKTVTATPVRAGHPATPQPPPHMQSADGWSPGMMWGVYPAMHAPPMHMGGMPYYPPPRYPPATRPYAYPHPHPHAHSGYGVQGYAGYPPLVSAPPASAGVGGHHHHHHHHQPRSAAPETAHANASVELLRRQSAGGGSPGSTAKEGTGAFSRTPSLVSSTSTLSSLATHSPPSPSVASASSATATVVPQSGRTGPRTRPGTNRLAPLGASASFPAGVGRTVRPMNRVVSSPAAITLGAGGKAAQYANLWMHLPSSPPPTPPRAKPRQEQDAGVGAGTETESDDDDERADRGLAQERAFVARGGPRTLEWACAKERVRGRTTDDGDGAMEKGLESAHAQAQVGEKRRRSGAAAAAAASASVTVASLLSSDPPSMPSRLAATSAPSSVRVPPPAQTIATSSPVPLTSKSAPPSPPPPRTDEMKEMADLLCQLARGPGRPQSTAAATS